MAYIIKIKYGNSLRRLTVPQEIYGGDIWSFVRLESRIRELLQVPASARLELTYTDSESDVVIMATDQDLEDALRTQKLNPLRVTATLVEDKPSSPPPRVTTTVAREEEKDATPLSKVELKPTSGIDIEVPLKQILSRLSSTSDAVVKKVVQSYEPLFEKVSSPAQATGLVENLMRTISAQVATAVKHGADAATSAAAAASATPAFGFGSGSSSGPATSPAPSSAAPATATATASPNTSSETTSSRSPDAFNAAVAEAAAVAQAAQAQAAAVTQAARAQAAAATAAALKETKESDWATVAVIHHGVTCDICDVNPIVGLRWKSMKRNNYDLCSSCFEKHGKQADFTKLEQSKFRPRRLYSHGPGRHFSQRVPMGNPFGGPNPGHFHGGRPFGGRCGSFGARHHVPMMGFNGKLDARFVNDVTMFDGTEVAPGTRFTKIWRLRNSGTIPWPMRTILVHVGGDGLSEMAMVPMEIPPEGLPAGGEMEAAVDMVAPEKPGRYVSHWRLASPAGPKFGHRIWAVIQVVSKVNEEQDDGQVEGEAAKENSKAVDVNETISGDQVDVDVDVTEPANEELTAEPEPTLNQLESTMSFVNVEAYSGEVAESSSAGSPADTMPEPEARELEVEPMQEKNLSEGYSMVNAPEQSVKPVEPVEPVEEETVEEQTPTSELAVEETLREERAVSQEVTPAEEGPISYPSVEDPTSDDGPISYPVIQLMSAAAPENEDVSQKTAATAVQDAEGFNLAALMAKLETMGFTNSKLNMELLEKNGLDMRQTLNDLCAVEEWDPILEELEEMGFYDTDVNRRLMFKNNGSVKRVVKELVTMYRDMSLQGDK